MVELALQGRGLGQVRRGQTGHRVVHQEVEENRRRPKDRGLLVLQVHLQRWDGWDPRTYHRHHYQERGMEERMGSVEKVPGLTVLFLRGS